MRLFFKIIFTYKIIYIYIKMVKYFCEKCGKIFSNTFKIEETYERKTLVFQWIKKEPQKTSKEPQDLKEPQESNCNNNTNYH